MTRVKMLALAGTTAIGAMIGLASPALADWDNIGNIDVNYGTDRDSTSPDFGGPVERLRLTATGGDVQCSSIRADYANGGSSKLFSGTLHQGDSRNVDVPGTRAIRRLDFTCHASSRHGAQIHMEADVGRYRDQWRASPEWARTWNKFMHWADVSVKRMTQDNWVLIGSAQFEGRDDRDGGVAGWGGRSISEIGFKPTNGDAVCQSVNVRFGNNVSKSYSINGGQPMSQDHTYTLDLPGDRRNVTNLSMRCHALGQRGVTINIYGNK